MNTFELTLSLPHDPRFAPAVRDLAIHAAQHLGCGEAKARAFGREAEELLRRCLDEAEPDGHIPVTVRRLTGPLELRIDDRVITLDISV